MIFKYLAIFTNIAALGCLAYILTLGKALNDFHDYIVFVGLLSVPLTSLAYIFFGSDTNGSYIRSYITRKNLEEKVKIIELEKITNDPTQGGPK